MSDLVERVAQVLAHKWAPSSLTHDLTPDQFWRDHVPRHEASRSINSARAVVDMVLDEAAKQCEADKGRFDTPDRIRALGGER